MNPHRRRERVPASSTEDPSSLAKRLAATEQQLDCGWRPKGGGVEGTYLCWAHNTPHVSSVFQFCFKVRVVGTYYQEKFSVRLGRLWKCNTATQTATIDCSQLLVSGGGVMHLIHIITMRKSILGNEGLPDTVPLPYVRTHRYAHSLNDLQVGRWQECGFRV